MLGEIGDHEVDELPVAQPQRCVVAGVAGGDPQEGTTGARPVASASLSGPIAA